MYGKKNKSYFIYHYGTLALKMAGNNWRQSILGDYDQMNLANEKYVYKEGLGLQRGYSVYFAWV